MLLASLLSARKASEELWQELHTASQHIASGLSNSLTLTMENIEGTLQLQAQDSRLADVLLHPAPERVAAARALLKTLTQSFPLIQGASLLDTKGDVVVCDATTCTGNFADRGYVKRALQGQTNISQPLLSRVTKQPVCLAATPVRDHGMRLSLVRANFLEQVGPSLKQTEVTGETLFLLGLFSLLDSLLDLPMEAIIITLPLDAPVKAALLGEDTTLGKLLHIAKCLETGNWGELESGVTRTGLSGADVANAYREALLRTGSLMESH